MQRRRFLPSILSDNAGIFRLCFLCRYDAQRPTGGFGNFLPRLIGLITLYNFAFDHFVEEYIFNLC